MQVIILYKILYSNKYYWNGTINTSIYKEEKIMIIDGNIFVGSQVIINGRVYGGETAKLKEYDEKKSEEVKGTVEKLTIESTFANVNISVSKSFKVEAHLYGEASLDKDIKLNVQRKGNEILVLTQYNGNCYGGKLNLDITVPNKTFKEITIRSSSADVTLENGISAQNIKIHTLSGDVNLNEGVWAKYLKVHTSLGDVTLDEGVSSQYIEVRTSSGDIETEATFTTANISATSGDIELYIYANNDINVNVSATSGDISTKFDNIGHINLSARAMTGEVKNRHKEGDFKYTANVEVCTMSGDIRIK